MIKSVVFYSYSIGVNESNDTIIIDSDVLPTESFYTNKSLISNSLNVYRNLPREDSEKKVVNLEDPLYRNHSVCKIFNVTDEYKVDEKFMVILNKMIAIYNVFRDELNRDKLGDMLTEWAKFQHELYQV